MARADAALPSPRRVSGIVSATQQSTEGGSPCALSAALLIGTSVLAIATPACGANRARNRPRRRSTRRQRRRRPPTPTKARSSSPRPSARRRVQDVPFSINAQTQADIQRANATTHRGHQPQRRRPDRPEPRPGPEPGVDPRRLRRPDRPRPAGREGTGRRLSRRKRRSRCRCSRPTSTCSTSTASRRCAARRARCSARARSAARSATSPTSRSSTGSKARSKPTSTSSTDGDIGYHLKGAINVPLGDDRGAARRSATTRIMPASSTRSARPAARTSTTATASAAASSLLFEPTPSIKITPRVVYQEVQADGFNREELYNLYDNQFTTARRR